jgi:hypothetical protein
MHPSNFIFFGGKIKIKSQHGTSEDQTDECA